MMALCVQEGLKLSKLGGICAGNATVRKPYYLNVKGHPSNPQFLPIFHCIAVLERIVASCHLVSVRP